MCQCRRSRDSSAPKYARRRGVFSNTPRRREEAASHRPRSPARARLPPPPPRDPQNRERESPAGVPAPEERPRRRGQAASRRGTRRRRHSDIRRQAALPTSRAHLYPPPREVRRLRACAVPPAWVRSSYLLISPPWPRLQMRCTVRVPHLLPQAGMRAFRSRMSGRATPTRVQERSCRAGVVRSRVRFPATCTSEARRFHLCYIHCPRSCCRTANPTPVAMRSRLATCTRTCARSAVFYTLCHPCFPARTSTGRRRAQLARAWRCRRRSGPRTRHPRFLRVGPRVPAHQRRQRRTTRTRKRLCV
mmetsp:Transcript_136/g.462  ORF Transcript_136/g.462 Transcript_136/m.462 type:complete len:304 (+) Transcript_136:327-1238(+)